MAPDPREARFCPYCGEQLRREAVDGRDLPAAALKPGCRSCRYVHLDAPTPVAAVLIEREGEVLLVRPHYAQEFALVAGYPEPYESIEAAAVREVREETGLEVRVERILGSSSCEPMGRKPGAGGLRGYGGRREVPAAGGGAGRGAVVPPWRVAGLGQ